MKFTFGIITSSGKVYLPDGKIRPDATNRHLVTCLESIFKLKIPKDSFEIVLVGGEDPAQFWSGPSSMIKWIPFDDEEKSGWITRKKNIITENSKFDNIVYMLDYYSLDDNWYSGFVEFGDSWDVCMCIKVSKEGIRFRDWIAWDDPTLCFTDGNPKAGYAPWTGRSEPYHIAVNVPYTYRKTKHLYVSGGYWVAKKSFMEKFPLDENVLWGQSEDVEWSKRWLTTEEYMYVMNTKSTVHLLKPKRLSCAYSDDGVRLFPGRSILSSKSGIPSCWRENEWYKNV